MKSSSLQLLGVRGGDRSQLSSSPGIALHWHRPKCRPSPGGQSARVQKLGTPSQFRTAPKGHSSFRKAQRLSFRSVTVTFTQFCFSHALTGVCAERCPRFSCFYKAISISESVSWSLDSTCDIYYLQWIVLQRSKCHVDNYTRRSWNTVDFKSEPFFGLCHSVLSI